MNWAIQVENLSKQYRIGAAVTPAFDSVYQIIEQKIASLARRARGVNTPIDMPVHHEPTGLSTHLVLTPEQQEGCPEGRFWALRDVSFEIKEGERVGIVGRNGSGKSTLLKILSRITAPTEGQFRFRGRLVSLLEVGTGFHPDLSGRENILLNAKINGMSSKAIRQIYDEIVDFSELGPQINTPIKRYSSGMYMRLAFSVAAHLESEILIVDEVLAVGDAGFQKKCLDKMLEVSGRGRTLLFVSHDMSAISSLCTKALELSHGSVVGDRPAKIDTPPEIDNSPAPVLQGLREVNAAISDYVMNGQTHCEMVWKGENAPQFKGGEVLLRKASVSDAQGEPRNNFDITDEVHIHVEFEVTAVKWQLNAHVYIKTMTGHPLLMSMDNQTVGAISAPHELGTYKQVCIIPANLLNEGGYRVEIVICTNPTSEFNIVMPDVLSFTMTDARKDGGVRGDWTREWPDYPIRTHLRWTIEHNGEL